MIETLKKERKSKPRENLTGKLFTYLTPLSYVKGGKWHCKCKCGNEIDVDTRNLKSGHTQSCGCFQKERASQNTIDMNGYENENIKVLNRNGSSKKNQSAKWLCLCKHCGNTFTTEGKSLRSGAINSCGCVHSNNEQIIINLLSENNIEFATQYTFSDLKGVNGGKLRFDFAIFQQGKLSHLIEYNGQQHYIQPDGIWKDGFETLQIHDKMKTQYCKNHNIPLKIIRYDEKYSILDLINKPVETIS